MQKRVYHEVPLGASKAQVVAWASANHFYVQPYGRQLDVVIEGTGGNIACSESTYILFSFDKAHRVAKREVGNGETCL